MQRNWKNLIRPKALEVVELTETYGKFSIEPLERGYGTTLGNSLRRVLLASIRGAAITGVRMAALGRVVREDDNGKGKTQRRMVEQMHTALHEFQALPDVVEDVAEIVLNLKEVNLRMEGEGPEYMDLVAEAPAGGAPLRVTAGMLQTPSSITVLNTDLHLMTIEPGGRVEMALTVKEGMGYVPATREAAEDAPVDLLPIDAIFGPVRRVNFRATNARVEQRTDYDKLTIEVWTNGAVDPETAVGIAAKILREQFKVFVAFEDDDDYEGDDGPTAIATTEPMNENLWKTIDSLELSVRSANCLQNANLRFVGELVQKTEAEMLKTKNFGRKSLKEIKDLLQEMGLSLGMYLDSWDPDSPPESMQQAHN
ncbi:MAG: DNA-directed RNA polymerase subunit alpha [Myxococcales bacterium]|nr:DNA-directed RNA polymerase subunit alpha [Myxococcales bacterium]